MTKRFVEAGHIFETIKKANGNIVLSYCGKENSFLQGCIWVCDDEAEVKDMVEAVIDPKRYADDEYRARHMAELFANVKW